MISRRGMVLTVSGLLVSLGMMMSFFPQGSAGQKVVAAVIVVAGLTGGAAAFSLYREMVRRDREYLAGRQDQQQP